MLKKKLRIQAIAQDIAESPTYTIKNLADKYHVSEMTVRRDVRFIEESGVLDQISSNTATHIPFDSGVAQ